MKPIISLCTSDEEDSDVEEVPAPSARAQGKRRMEDDGCQVVGQKALRPMEDADDEEQEVQCTGRAGQFALEDFPHARENCGKHAFEPGKEHVHCSNCYCYVCDKPASQCTSWTCGDKHCLATHRDAKYGALRAAMRKAATLLPPPAPRAPAASSSNAPLPARRVSSAGWSCEQVLAGVEQVYPEEAPQPQGLAAGTVLKPYQRQSLAFMLNVEHGRHGVAGVRTFLPFHVSMAGRRTDMQVRGGWLASEMGMGKNAHDHLAHPCPSAAECTEDPSGGCA